MEETKSQKSYVDEVEHLTKRICKVHLYDTLKFVVCVGAIGACAEIALLTHSTQTRKIALVGAVSTGVVHISAGKMLNKKKQKLREKRTQLLKHRNQYSKA